MITMELITAVFSAVDEEMGAISTPSEAHLWPSAVVPWDWCMLSQA